MTRLITICVTLIAVSIPAFAASEKQPAPTGAPQDAPPQFTSFTAAELERGFLALAFGSDLRIGARPLGIRRFDHPIHVRVFGGGSVDRMIAMSRAIADYAREVPSLQLRETSATEADVELRLIDEKDFQSALQLAFGPNSTIPITNTAAKRSSSTPASTMIGMNSERSRPKMKTPFSRTRKPSTWFTAFFLVTTRSIPAHTVESAVGTR